MKNACFSILFFCICMQASAYVTQSNWRWRNNDGDETTATWKAEQSQQITIGSIDSVLRLRIQFENNTGSDKTFNSNLQYASAPDGPWRYVTNYKGNNAFMLTSANAYVSDLTLTTQQTTGSTNTFFAGKELVKTNELDYFIPDSATTEHEYSLKPTDNIEPNRTYYFRVPTGDDPVSLPSLNTTSTINTKPRLLSNGSFENGLNDWAFTVGSGASATQNIIDSVHKEGLNSLVINLNNAGSAAPVMLDHQAVALNVGHTYMVRFWAFAKKYSAEMQLALKGSKTLTYDYKLHTGWREYQFAFKAFEPNVNVSFLFQSATEYTIDRVEILNEDNEGVDVPMNYMWQNRRSETEYGWLTADGELSELLPDGRTAWTFSDGWYGYNDTTTNSINTNRLIRNCLVVQDAPSPEGNLVTKIGGTPQNPEPLMVPPDPIGYEDFLWPREMIVENDSLKILSPDVQITNQGDPISGGNREALAIFSLPDLTLQRIEWLPYLSDVEYRALVKADDGYTYAYASKNTDVFGSNTIVARFPTGQLSATTPWEYLTETGWSYNDENSKIIADVDLWSVARLGPNNYVAMFKYFLSDKAEAMFAQSPIGPWVGRSIIGQTEGQAEMVNYFAVPHEGTANNGIYTFSYSNNGDIGQMVNDKTVYWPTYLKADLKMLSPFTDAVLPVTLLDFTAKAKGKKVLLQWKTVTETNNDHFVIERSTDGRSNWRTVASVKSKGNSLEAQSYSTYDAHPVNGDNYYRLKQVDKDGKFSLSDVKLVTMQLIKAVLSVYPNPTKGDINFILSNYSGGTITAKLADINGNIVHTEVISVNSANTYKLNITNKLSPGTYMLQLTGKEIKETAKVVVQ